MTTGTVPQDVKEYLSVVRARLDDLPAEERDDLLADVEPSILDSAEDSDAPVALRLGPPESFADELRAAAGLPPRTEGAAGASRLGLTERLTDAYRYFATSPATGWLRDLAPLWWVLRGVVVVGLLELLMDQSVVEGDDGYAFLVALAAALAAVVSIAVGLRRPRRNGAIVVVNVMLALAAIPVLWNAISAGHAAVFDNAVVTEAPVQEPPPGLAYQGSPVENLYAFDREGRLLQDVRLFMQDGGPLELGGQDPNRRPVRTRGGRLALNAFPIRYFEPGTKQVADPAAGAPSSPGRLTTKPLRP
jgi:hypothetical protein